MPLLESFLQSISGFIKSNDSNSLRNWLEVEPPVSQALTNLAAELKQSWQNSDKLLKLIQKLVPASEDEQGTYREHGAWPFFHTFMKEYLLYWRDADFGDLIGTQQTLADLTVECIKAVNYSAYAIVMLPTMETICRTLLKLTTTLENRPDLKQQLRLQFDDQGKRVTLSDNVEKVIQNALFACLIERSANRNGIKDGKPEGKKIGIYIFANMQLKLLSQSRKWKTAENIFTNITQKSPPLGLYPASQRVTYLYYLGRYHFSNTHYYFAQKALESAYAQCHAQCISQRRLILVYLISCNMILGRFPTAAFLSRPEAASLLPKFMPIAEAIKKGNMMAFKRALGPESGNEQWFIKHGIYLALLSRCEVLVWRTFARRVFLLTFEGIAHNSAGQLKAPALDISNLVVAAQYCQKLLEGWSKPNAMFNQGGLQPPPNGPKKLGPYGGIIFRNKMPQLDDIEAILASLVSQGLLGGYLSHEYGKFAIVGSKAKGGPLPAGFPEVWAVLKAKAAREGRDGDCPGWVEKERSIGGGGVVNLSNVKPVGGG